MPTLTKRLRIRQRMAFVLLGALAGAAAMMLVQGKAMDNLYLKHANLTIQYDDLQQELTHLQQEVYLLTAQSARNVVNPTLKSMKITVSNANPMTQVEVTKFVKASLGFLIGTQIRVFADTPSIMSAVVDRKTLTVNGQRLALYLRTAVIVNDTLYITVETKTIP